MTCLMPSVAVDRLFPPLTAFMARTDLTQTRLLGYRKINLDAVTTVAAGLLNGRPTVRHRSGVTGLIMQTYARAGLRVAEDIRPYDTRDQAESAADALIARGYRLLGAYPHPAGRYAHSALLVPPALWHRLNAKDHLPDIVPPENLMSRQTIPLASLADRNFEFPVWLKAAGSQPTGWGFAVRYCPDRKTLMNAIADFRAMPGVTHVIAEADAQTEHCWCASIVVDDMGTTYAGFAEQEFASPGHQSGSVINPENPFPSGGQRLAVAVGEAARKQGFRGIAGLDIGMTPEGRFVVFDPNFRLNASTAQALFHGAATARVGLPVSRSFHALTDLPCATAIDRVLPALDAGWFIPTRLLDGALLPAALGKSYVTGFVLGHDPADAQVRSAQLQSALAA